MPAGKHPFDQSLKLGLMQAGYRLQAPGCELPL
jgi:hypothetical protein